MVNWVIFILLSFIWGSSFMLMKEGMVGLSPYQVASIRMLSAGIILVPFAIRDLKKFPVKKTGLVILSGLLGSFFPAFLFCIAETRIDGSLAGILNALTPLCTLLLAVFFFKTPIPARKFVGIVIGFLGLCLLFIVRGNINLSYLSYSGLVILATLCYGANVNLVSKHLKEVGSFQIATYAFTILTIPSLIILILTGYFSMPLTSKEVLYATGASVVLGIFGTAVASILFYVLVKRAGIVFSSMVTYGIPFVAIFWGLLAHEEITLAQAGCLCIILFGVYITTKSK
ncbi:MAG TPA: DMT family transporter [Parasegetibacter sp.]